MPAVSIIDIARKAGVGKSTAARVLSGEGSVSEDSRVKVMTAAASLKYRANSAARALRSGRNRLLGLLVPESNSHGFLSHAVTAQKLEGIAQGAKRHGYDLQIFIENLRDGEALHRLAVNKDVSGFFLLGQVEPAVLEMLKRYHIPWIGVNWRLPGRGSDPHCWTDFSHAAATLVGHLADVGCRRVVACDWLSLDFGPFGRNVRSEWMRRGLPASDLIVHTGREYTGADAVLKALHSAFASRQRPDGILLSYDQSAAAAYHFLAERGLRPGRDVAIATFDDLGVPERLTPPCTAYAQPCRALGECAVAEMDRVLSGETAGHISRALPGQLQIRPSTALFARR
jgi:DNA-binding LacI/PurR family transcriptional regulator